MENRCDFQNGWCKSCGKSQGQGEILCFYDDQFYQDIEINKVSIEHVKIHKRKQIKSSVRQSVYNRDGRKCLKCGTTEGLTIDHVIPLSIGGKNSTSNYQTLCGKCNVEKKDMPIDYRNNRKV